MATETRYRISVVVKKAALGDVLDLFPPGMKPDIERLKYTPVDNIAKTAEVQTGGYKRGPYSTGKKSAGYAPRQKAPSQTHQAYAYILRKGHKPFLVSEMKVALDTSKGVVDGVIYRLAKIGKLKRVGHGLWQATKKMDNLGLPEADYPPRSEVKASGVNDTIVEQDDTIDLGPVDENIIHAG